MKSNNYIAPEITQVIVCQTEALCLSQGDGTTENYTINNLDWDE